MTYTLNKKLAEAEAIFLICEAIRMILIKERDDGVSHSELLKKLIAFYRVTSPDMADALERFPAEKQYGHLVGVLGSQILIYLRHDEFVNFSKVREYLKETWPEVDQEFFEKPRTFSYVSIGGQKFAVNPGNPILLEKIDSVPEWPAGVLMEKTGPDWTQTSSSKLRELLKPDGGAENDQVIDRSVGVQAALYRYHTALVDMCQRNDIHFGLEWLHFETFRVWAMDSGYKPGMSLERKVLQLGYVPGNVSWQERTPRSRELDPQTHDRAEMDDYLKSRNIDPAKLSHMDIEISGYQTSPKPSNRDKK